MRIINIILFLISSQFTYSQPEPITIQFVEAQPLWEHIIWDTNYYDVGIQPGLNKYTTVHPHQCYRYNDDIIIASQCFNFNAETYGYILEKLDIESGQMKWQNFHTFYNGGFQDYYKNMYLRPDGNVEMIGIKLHGEYVDSIFGYWNVGGGRSNFVRKIFNFESGELMKAIIGQDSVEDFIPQYVHFYPIKHDSAYVVLNLDYEIINADYEYGYYFYELNHEHNLVGNQPKSRILYETPDELGVFSIGQPQYTQQIDDSTFVGIIFQDKLHPDNAKVQLIWFSINERTEIKFIKRLNIEHLIPGKETSFLYLTFDLADGRIYLSQPYKDFSINEHTTYLVCLDKEGNLVHHIPSVRVDNHYYRSIRLLYSSPEYDYFAGFLSNTGRTGLDVLKLRRGSNEFEYISSLTSAFEDEEFTRELAVSKLYEDGLFILGAYTKKLGPEQNVAVKYYCFNGADLGMQLATSNQNISQNEKIKVFPNPTTGLTTLHFDKEFTGDVQLFDVEGILVKGYQLTSENSLQISLQDLPSGVYYATITDSRSNQKSTVKILKISDN